jgi:hypothetical protein
MPGSEENMGKFDNDMDAYIYGLSLDGCDEECGDSVDGTGWYGLVVGNLADADRAEFAELSSEDQTELAGYAGAIIGEDTQGFVSVEYFETETELRETWAQVLTDVGELEQC